MPPCLSLMDCRSPSTGVNLGAKGGGGEGEECRAACERKVERGGRTSKQQRPQLCQYQMEPEREKQGGRGTTRTAGNKKVSYVHHGLGRPSVVLWERGRKGHLAHKRILYFPFSASHPRRRCCREEELAIPSSDGTDRERERPMVRSKGRKDGGREAPCCFRRCPRANRRRHFFPFFSFFSVATSMMCCDWNTNDKVGGGTDGRTGEGACQTAAASLAPPFC